MLAGASKGDSKVDKKIAGAIGALSALAALGAAPASAAQAPSADDALSARSFTELLQPIPNALAKLQADEARLRSETGVMRLAYHHHHHHHHPHHKWW